MVAGYYESYMTWSLAGKLKKALEARGFEVGLTRQTMEDDPELTERGRRAAGYDLLVSLHSNAAGSEAPDAPWIIHFSPDGKTDIDEKSKSVGDLLGPVISNVMGVSAPYYYTKDCGNYDRDGNGFYDDEWYGVLFGAKSVGVPGIIVEHSFHTNKKAARWLLDEDNLTKLAKAEADALAEYYGTEDVAMTAKEKKEFEALREEVVSLGTKVKTLESEKNALQKRLGKYDKMGVYDNAAVKWAYVDGNLPEWAAPTIKKLVKAGHLKGNENNSLELSELMMRILVILDRAGTFE